ncbi:MAG: S8 family serine peptidase, partial [Acidimicrobiia bacterium]|nr:S8 family serine peptidase [Acidimicrobiia bacterium]
MLVTCLALLATVVPPVAAAPPEDPAARQRVIVRIRDNGPAPRGLADQIVAAHGGRVGATYEYAVKGFVAELPQAAIDALVRNPNVLDVSPDVLVSIADQDVPTGFDRIEADLVPRSGVPTALPCPSGTNCTDVDIAIIDTGSNDHPDLNVVHRVDCSSLFGSCTDNAGFDGHGHGTHVAGIAAALDNGYGVVGVARGARIWSVKVLGDEGTGFLSSILGGIDWVTARADEIDVANMSLAGIFNNSTFDDAITASVAAGITYAVAAGNDGADAAAYSPANHPDVITVSALADGDGAAGGRGKFFNRPGETDGTLATFSNYGAAVDIAAPGVNIRSTWKGSAYAIKSGTSMASPQVAGAAALYIAIHGRDTNNDLTIDGADVAFLKDALLADAIPQTDPCGFSGDPDAATYPEPLLFVNGDSFGGDGTCTVAPPDSSGPPAPALTATTGGYPVDLTWGAVTDPESGILNYEIRRDTDPGTGEILLAEMDHSVLSYRDSATEPGTTYVYRMLAVNRQGLAGPFSAPITAATSADDPTDAGWWALDDGGGTEAADTSAWRNHGTLVNGPAWEEIGRVGGALRLDGSDDRVDLDATILDGAGDITASMWIKTSKTGQQALVSGANAGNSNEYLIFLASSTQLRLYAGENASGAFQWTIPSLADGAWHHLAVVRNDTLNQATVYVDGIRQTLFGSTLNPIDLDTGGLLLGQEQDSVGGGFDPGQAFSGSLDEVRLFTRVLTQAEIDLLALRDGTPPSPPATLSAVANGSDVDLTWGAADDADSGISAYQIRRGTTPGALTRLTEVPGTATFYRDTATLPGTPYYYEVVAVNGALLPGPPSPGASATTGSGDPTLAGWWTLDDGSGLAAGDSSPAGRDGTLVNGPVWAATGQTRGALTFDGNDDRVDLDPAILDGASDVTVALWVKTTKKGLQALVSGANAGNDAEFELFPVSDTTIRFYTGELNTTFVVWTVPSFADGAWHHLAVTRDAGSDQATLFLDGESQGPRGAILGPIAIEGLVLGQDQDVVGGGFDPTQAFTGAMDEVRLYSRLLSVAEIADLAGQGVPETTVPEQVPGFSVGFSGDDWVTVANDGSLQLTGDSSFELWLRPDDVSVRRNPLAKAYAGEGTITQETDGR